jgi:phenylalanyl-tRNA synthetase alpha chain
MITQPLTENEKKVLKVLTAYQQPLWVDDIVRETGLPRSTVESVIEHLKGKGLVVEEKIHEIKYYLTERGKEVLREGFPEEKLLKIIDGRKEVPLKELKEKMGGKELGLALGEAKKRGIISIEKGILIIKEDKTAEIEKEKEILEKIKRGEDVSSSEDIVSSFLKRGLVERRLVKKRRIRPLLPAAREALEKAEKTVSTLSSRMIVTGEWKHYIFKPYNITAEPPYLPHGFPHYYVEFIDYIRRILYEMGFTETIGPFIVPEFWNFDVLFQAQDHPAREVHDTFWLDLKPTEEPAEKELIERTKAIHETGGTSSSRGWGGRWSREIASRMVLRTQMTCVSARVLSKRPKPPFRFFSIGTVFRPDVIDSRHLPNFVQFDGIISEENMSFAKLLGTLKEFFERLGLKELRFKPGYFPFTEPSVEGYVKIPGIGWIEVFGAGLFRPEVLEILGIDYDVGAWGMGLERIAMSLMSINDIRKLYSRKTSELEKLYLRYLKTILNKEGR